MTNGTFERRGGATRDTFTEDARADMTTEERATYRRGMARRTEYAGRAQRVVPDVALDAARARLSR